MENEVIFNDNLAFKSIDDWEEVQIKDIVSILGDGLHGTPCYSDNGDYYFINGNNLSNGLIVLNDKTQRIEQSEFEKYKKNLNDRTILVSINGTIGNVALYNGEKVILGKSACYFNVLPDVDKLFVRYVVSSPLFVEYLESYATGTTIKNVSLKSMREFKFKLPPLSIQKSIAHILGSLDDKIELNRRMNQTLEQMAQALFKSWFVDFDPVIDNALAAGNPIPDELQERAQARQALGNNRKPLPAHVQQLFPNEFEFSEVLEKWVPRGWRVGKLDEIAEVSYGKDHKNLNAGNIPVYGSGGIMRYADRFLYDKESVLIPRKGTLSNILYVNKPFWSVDTMFFTKFKLANHAKYLYYILKPLDFASMNVGSAVPSMTTVVLNNIDVIMPDVNVMTQFDSILASWYERTEFLDSQIKALVKLRDTLLPKLITGELRLPDAEKLLVQATSINIAAEP